MFVKLFWCLEVLTADGMIELGCRSIAYNPAAGKIEFHQWVKGFLAVDLRFG